MYSVKTVKNKPVEKPRKRTEKKKAEELFFMEESAFEFAKKKERAKLKTKVQQNLFDDIVREYSKFIFEKEKKGEYDYDHLEDPTSVKFVDLIGPVISIGAKLRRKRKKNDLLRKLAVAKKKGKPNYILYRNRVYKQIFDHFFNKKSFKDAYLEEVDKMIVAEKKDMNEVRKMIEELKGVDEKKKILHDKDVIDMIIFIEKL